MGIYQSNDKTNYRYQKQQMINWKDVIERVNHGNPKPDRVVHKSEEEWKAILTEEQFRITRRRGTEAAHSGALCSIFENGKYNCICCYTLLFDSTEKFNSSSGWPSFTRPIKDNAIRFEKDTSFGMFRVETVCNTCEAHLGHVFPDGPTSSGLRFCINSEAIHLNNTN